MSSFANRHSSFLWLSILWPFFYDCHFTRRLWKNIVTWLNVTNLFPSTWELGPWRECPTFMEQQARVHLAARKNILLFVKWQTQGIALFVVFCQTTFIFSTIAGSIDNCGRTSWHGFMSQTFCQVLGVGPTLKMLSHIVEQNASCSLCGKEGISDYLSTHGLMTNTENCPPLSSFARDSCFWLKSLACRSSSSFFATTLMANTFFL